MKHALTLTLALFLAAQSQSATAHEVKVGDLDIIHPHINLPAKGAQTAAGYMGISNDGTTPDHLIGIEASFAQKAQVHNSAVDANGVASMAAVETLEIPPGETVVLEPGALHVMLMGLTADLHEGDMLPATLIFDHAGRVDIDFMVTNADGSMEGMDHSKMEMTAPAKPQATTNP